MHFFIIYVIFLLMISCAKKPQMSSELAVKYNTNLKKLDNDLENFRKALYTILFTNKRIGKIDHLRVDSFVYTISKPFIYKFELFNEIKNNVEEPLFLALIKQDRLSLIGDKVSFQESLDAALKKINVNRVVVNIGKGLEKNCHYFESYLKEIKNIFGEGNDIVKKLYNYRKETFALYNNTGSLKIYFGTDGVEQLCIKQINDIVIGLNMTVTNSFD